VFKSNPPSTHEPLELIHADLAGPMETLSIDGFRFTLVLICDCSKHIWVFLMKSKDETLRNFMAFVLSIEKLTGRKIKIFRSDRGGEFMSDAFNKFLEEHGITRQTSAPYTPQQNGTAERTVQTLVGSARAMLQHSGMSKGFWGEAIRTSVHVLNRSPRKGLDWKTPYEVLFGRIPEVSYLRVFGCRAWVHTHKDQKKKWDPTSKPMVFVGYELGSRAYRLWNPASRSIVISASVRFDETQFPNRSRPDAAVAGPSRLIPKPNQFPPDDCFYTILPELAEEESTPPPPGPLDKGKGKETTRESPKPPSPPPSPPPPDDDSSSDSESIPGNKPEEPPAPRRSARTVKPVKKFKAKFIAGGCQGHSVPRPLQETTRHYESLTDS